MEGLTTEYVNNLQFIGRNIKRCEEQIKITNERLNNQTAELKKYQRQMAKINGWC